RSRERRSSAAARCPICVGTSSPTVRCNCLLRGWHNVALLRCLHERWQNPQQDSDANECPYEICADFVDPSETIRRYTTRGNRDTQQKCANNGRATACYHQRPTDPLRRDRNPPDKGQYFDWSMRFATPPQAKTTRMARRQPLPHTVSFGFQVRTTRLP